MGSVKDIEVLEEPDPDSTGRGLFRFSGRYSVFDWGEMPDHISGKDKSLAMMSAFNFEKLEERDVETHYEGMVEDGEVRYVTREPRLEEPSKVMAVKLAQVPEVESNGNGHVYEDLRDSDNYLVPLEMIFRNSVPPGSSLRRRKSPGDIDLTYDDWPQCGIDLTDPLVEFSTKLEEKDRYIGEEEAREISGLTSEELKEIDELAREVNGYLNERAENRGFDHEDGKIEFVYSDGEIVLADTVGTFDENRFTYRGKGISKEFLRQWYREKDSEWYENVREAKEKVDGDWKELCDSKPRDLNREVKGIAENMYMAGANQWLGEEWFEEVPPLEDVITEI